MNQLVSVIIPAYNAARFIEATLDSVIAQTYTNLEIIIVDDGSTDNTRELIEPYLKDPRVRLICQANAGVHAARNKGIENSSGEFIAPVDADDIWFPAKIEKQVRAMQSNPNAGLVYAWTVHLDEEGNLNGDYLAQTRTGNVLRAMLEQELIGSASIPLFRRTCLDDVGYYRAGYKGVEDFELYMRVAEKWEYDVAPDFLIGYRMVQGSMSRNTGMMWKHLAKILDEVQSRHPEISARLFQELKANNCAWLADLSRQGGQHLESLSFWLQAIRLNPKKYLLHPRTYKKSIISLFSLILSPITKRIWTLEEWEAFKHKLRPPRQIASLDELRARVAESMPLKDTSPQNEEECVSIKRSLLKTAPPNQRSTTKSEQRPR
jgi:glycosyltransferase involved in cell wall biosynthesis